MIHSNYIANMRLKLLLLLLIPLSHAKFLKNKVLNFDISLDGPSSDYLLKENNDELCIQQFSLYQAGVLQREEWAMQMFDATSKLQSGILFGNQAEMGSFNECLSVQKKLFPQNATVSGKYCLGTITGMSLPVKVAKNQARFKNIQHNIRTLTREGVAIEDLGLLWAGCIPASCSPALGSNLTMKAMELLKLEIKVQFTENMCTSKADEPDVTVGDIAVMCVFGILIFVVATSTLYDLYLQKFDKKAPHPIFMVFSGYTNSQKLFAISKSDEQFSCLNGIRVISLMWVILGHEFTTFVVAPIVNGLDVVEWMDSKYSMYMSGATVSVDSFFVLSGLLMSYGFFRAMSKGIKFDVVTYYLHRYIRLTPALLGVILVHLTILKHLGSGPLYKSYMETDGCSEAWWPTLLYLQNYVFPGDVKAISCVRQTWYLAVDMQLFILSPLILIPLWKWPKKALLFLAVLICGSITIPFIIGWVNEYPGSLINEGEKIDDMMRNVYVKTHCRAAPWLIGIGLGYFIYRYKNEKSYCNISKVLINIITGLSLSVLCVCVFAGHDVYKKEYAIFEQVAYLSFIRPSWALALSWLIYACIIGQGGPINWILSFPIYQVIGRFTYSMYLLHSTLLFIGSHSRKVPAYFSDYAILHKFWGDFVFSFCLAYIWILMFESPMIGIEKIIIGKGNTKLPAHQLKNVRIENNTVEKHAS